MSVLVVLQKTDILENSVVDNKSGDQDQEGAKKDNIFSSEDEDNDEGLFSLDEDDDLRLSPEVNAAIAAICRVMLPWLTTACI